MKYECECIKNMELFESSKKCIHLKQTTDLTSLLLTIIDIIDQIMKIITRNALTVK